jgi:LysR family positive regulator for ilvC
MDIQSLKTFIKTAELLHFGKASRACHLSPSALTRTIQRQEEEVGATLFIRDNRSVELTDAGRKLLGYARNAVMDWDEFQHDLSAQETVNGTLSLYASITAVYSLLPDLLESYRAAYPDVQLELRTGAAEQSVEQVLIGEIDLAVAALPDQKPTRLQFMPLAETPLVFIAPKPPGALKAIRFQAAEPLVVPQAGTARNRLDAWFRKQGMIPNIASEVSGNEALIALVRLGNGIGIVPLLALERSPFRDEIAVIENAPRLNPYVVGLCSSRRSLKRPAVKAMWQLAEKI